MFLVEKEAMDSSKPPRTFELSNNAQRLDSAAGTAEGAVHVVLHKAKHTEACLVTCKHKHKHQQPEQI